MNSHAALDNLTPEQKRELLRNLLKERSAGAATFPMSLGQQGLWHAFQRDRASTAYNVFLPSRIRARLNMAALQRAIEWLAERHAALRTTFSAESGKLQQTVHANLTPEFLVNDAAGLSEHDLRAAVLRETQRPFDLTTGPLIRVACFPVSETDCVVVATAHHIVVDFWSLILVMQGIRIAYAAFAAGELPDLPAAPSNYQEFVDHQSRRLDSPDSEEDGRYWDKTIQGIPTVLEWATDFHRPESFTGQAGVVTFSLPADVVEEIRRIASECGVTPNAVVMTVLSVFIARSTSQDSFLIGMPFSGRTHQRFESTVGFFVNMLPIVTDITSNPTFLELVKESGRRMIGALEHEQLPFSEIVRRASPKRDPGRSPLFQVACTFEKSHLRSEIGRAGFLMNSSQSYIDDGGLAQESFYVPHPTCHHDVEFVFEFAPHELRGLICYCSDLFENETVQIMADNFRELTKQLLAHPRKPVKTVAWSDALPDQTRQPTGNDSELGTRDTLQSLLLKRFGGSFAGNVALQSDSGSLTYSQLLEQANGIAGELRRLGVGNKSLVPVSASRGVSAVVGVLGVIAAGAAFVPIDRDQPAVSAEQLERDTDVPIVLVDALGDWDARFPPERRLVIDGKLLPPASKLSFDTQPSDLAYVIYTSGSTGMPKGVQIPHRGVANTLLWRTREVPLSVNDRVLMLLSHQFDASFVVLFGSLSQGATVVWPDGNVFCDPDSLIEQIMRHSITVLPAVPSLIRVLLDRPRFQEITSLRQIWCGGETMPSDLPSLVRERSGVELWNFYGPTECSIEAAAHCATDHPKHRRVPIGHEIDHTEIVVLDDSLQRVPKTVPGQLAILGRGLANGYLNDPAKTSDCFRQAYWDAAGEKMYLTGDFGRRRFDGQLEFLGREDGQVKLGGYRIELEEIERVVAAHRQVAAAACKVLRPETPAAQLIVFMVPDDTACDEQGRLTEDASQSISRFVAERLPAYKRPAAYVPLSELPTGTSGKVLRGQLPTEVPTTNRSAGLVEPQTDLEKFLAAIWAKTLGMEAVGVTENFFQLGGSSLQAAMLTTELSQQLEIDVPTALLFDLADISQLSRRLVELHEPQMLARFGPASVESAKRLHAADTATAAHPLLVPLKPDGTQPPLFLIHPPGGIVACYRELAEVLPDDQPLWAIRSRGLHGAERLPESIEEMARDYVNAIHSICPQGPCRVGGWSLGGVIAYDVVQQLLAGGVKVERLILLDSTVPENSEPTTDGVDAPSQVGLEYGIDLSLRELTQLSHDEVLPLLYRHAQQLGVLQDEMPPEVVEKIIQDLKHLFHHHVKLASDYELKPLSVQTLLVRPRDTPVAVTTQSSADRGWGRWVQQIDVRFMAGHHHSMVQSPHVVELAGLLSVQTAKRSP